MSAPATAPLDPQSGPSPSRGVAIVKQILSGDTITVRKRPTSGPPPEKNISFSHLVIAPKLARRPKNEGEATKDDPWAWEAREFLRKKLVGKEVSFIAEKTATPKREVGTVYLGKDYEKGENIVELLVSEGLVSVKKTATPSPEVQRLIQLEEKAKLEGKGKWGNSPPTEHIRDIKWTQEENLKQIFESCRGKPVKAIIEHVRDGSTVRAFLLPDFNYVNLIISGIRANQMKKDSSNKTDTNVENPYFEEAKFFVESRLLQRDVEIRLEGIRNNNLVGTILHPDGNIAESLLRQGLARCADWSIELMESGVDKLRAAERYAKEKRLREWKDYQSNAQQFSGKEKDFTGTVVEVFNGDAIMVRLSNGSEKKVFLSSIRPPRETSQDNDGDAKPQPRAKNFRPLYDIVWMFEAREFLRKKLISKKVHCTLDYTSPPHGNFPEKYCYTVTIGGTNVAETMVSKGLATVIRHRQDDDQRSSHYDQLLDAQKQAEKGQKGVHLKDKKGAHRINDLTADHSRIKPLYLPSWQRALHTEAIVEFVASGSRLRLYIPKDSVLVTFLLAGISCPRSGRQAANGIPAQEGEPFGDEALAFTRDKVLQRDVNVHIETTDKAGSCVIGWLWTENKMNLSIALVEEGLAEVHFSAEKSEHCRALKAAEEKAKAAKKNIWSTYVEEVIEKVEEEKEEKVTERKINYETVIVTEVTNDLHFFVQNTEQGGTLENVMSKLRQEFQINPPVSGAYTPKRGDMCAAQFSEDKEWYRAKVEKVQNGVATVSYIDYGNKENVPFSRLAALPPGFTSDKPYASQYNLALVKLPDDNEYKEDAIRAFTQDVFNRKLLLNVEYKTTNVPSATLHDPSNNNFDIGKGLVTDGVLLVDMRKERKLKDVVEEYKEAQQEAKKNRRGIWEYGDITQDDAVEFGR